MSWGMQCLAIFYIIKVLSWKKNFILIRKLTFSYLTNFLKPIMFFKVYDFNLYIQNWKKKAHETLNYFFFYKKNFKLLNDSYYAIIGLVYKHAAHNVLAMARTHWPNIYIYIYLVVSPNKSIWKRRCRQSK